MSAVKTSTMMTVSTMSMRDRDGRRTGLAVGVTAQADIHLMPRWCSQGGINRRRLSKGLGWNQGDDTRKQQCLHYAIIAEVRADGEAEEA